MKTTSLLLLGCAALVRAACNANNCARAVTGTANGLAAQASHKQDCSSYLKATVTPATTTFTVYATVTTSTYTSVETVILSSTTTISTTTTAAAAKAKRQVTVNPSKIPAYASACTKSNDYSSACSCFGVSPTTITAATPSTTITITASVIASTTTFTTTTAISTATVVSTVVPALPPTCPNASGGTTPGCSAAVACGGGNSGYCICEQTTEGRNVCIYEENVGCGADCTSSAQCGEGYSCVVSVCCSVGGSCLPSGASLGNTCTSVSAKVKRQLRGLERRADVGSPLHLPPSDV